MGSNSGRVRRFVLTCASVCSSNSWLSQEEQQAPMCPLLVDNVNRLTEALSLAHVVNTPTTDRPKTDEEHIVFKLNSAKRAIYMVSSSLHPECQLRSCRPFVQVTTLIQRNTTSNDWAYRVAKVLFHREKIEPHSDDDLQASSDEPELYWAPAVVSYLVMVCIALVCLGGCCYYRRSHKYTALNHLDLDLGELEGDSNGRLSPSPTGRMTFQDEDEDLEAFHGGKFAID